MVKYNLIKIYITVLLGIFISSCNNNQEQTENKKKGAKVPAAVSNEIPEHSIEFPKAELENHVVEKKVSTLFDLTITQWILEGKDENGSFMYFVAHNKVPAELVTLIQNQPEQLNAALQAMLTGSAEKLGGFDFVYTETEYDGHPGMYSKCKVFNGEGMIKSVVYLFDKDIFVISGGGKGIDEEKLDTFLSSFKLTE